jgi:hypothetical protein
MFPSFGGFARSESYEGIEGGRLSFEFLISSICLTSGYSIKIFAKGGNSNPFYSY